MSELGKLKFLGTLFGAKVWLETDSQEVLIKAENELTRLHERDVILRNLETEKEAKDFKLSK